MKYRGPSANRPAKELAGDVFPWRCPIGRFRCYSSLSGVRCPRFGRLRSCGDEVVCLDDPSAGPSLSEVLDALIEKGANHVADDRPTD